MELLHGSRKASKLTQDDVISSMPDDVIINILMRLPLQDVVRTGILSTNWRHKWTMLTQLVFDEEFYDFLKTKGKEKDYGRIIDMFLDRLKGTILKFYLYIEEGCLNVQDIDNWLLVLSEKEIMEFTLINMDETLISLTTHLFYCLKLKHLELFNCHICPIEGFGGFPNLLSLDLSEVEFESYTCGEFISHCPLLENLELRSNSSSEIKRVEIVKLENLKVLNLPLCELDNMAMITSSSIFQLISCFSKLQELNLNFWICNVSKDAEMSVPTLLPCIKTLRLYEIDFSNKITLSCAIDLIFACLNLETLLIKATYEEELPAPASSFSQVNFRRIREMQLRKVVFVSVRGLENELCLMKFLLDCSRFLKLMDISVNLLKVLGGDRGALMFATKLLELPRASPEAEIHFDF